MDVVLGMRASVAMALGVCALWSAAAAQTPTLPESTAALAKDRFALVIGNDDYWHAQQLPRLQNAVRDAEAMARKLEHELGFQVILKTNAERKVVLQELHALTKSLEQNPNAVGLFYFAGHGMQVNDRNFLIGVEAKLESPALMQDFTVPADRVVGDMVRAMNRLNIVILDACRDNPFQLMRAGIKLGAPTPVSPAPFQVKSGLATMPVPSTSGRAFLIAFAAGAGERAADSGPDENGLFTAALLRALDEPGLPATQVFEQTRITVARRSGGKQSPFVAIQGADDFRFRSDPQVAVAPPAAAPARPARSRFDEEVDWRQVRNEKSTALFEWFLGRHPEGKYRVEASQKLAALKAEVEEAAFWDGVQRTRSPDQYEEFLQRYPNSKFARLAEAILKGIRDNNPPPATTPLHAAIDPDKQRNIVKPAPAPAPANPPPQPVASKPAVPQPTVATQAQRPAEPVRTVLKQEAPVAPPPPPPEPAARQAALPLPVFMHLPPIGNVAPTGSDGRWSGTLVRADVDSEERHLCRPGQAEFKVDQGRIVGVRVELDDKRIYELDLAGTSYYRASVDGDLPPSGAVDGLIVRLFNEINTNFTSYRFQGSIDGDRFTGSWRMDGYRCRGTFAFARATP